MPWLDIGASALSALAVVAGILTRRRSATGFTFLWLASTLAVAIAFALEGARPQLVALGILNFLSIGIVLWHRSLRAPRLAFSTSTAIVVSFAVVGGTAWALPPIFVPVGAGPHGVGLDTLVWTDVTRNPNGAPTDSSGVRSLPMTVWYPSQERGLQADYIPGKERAEKISTSLAAMYGAPTLLLESLTKGKSNASWQSKPAEGPFPLVIASPGLNSSRWLFTTWAEELARNGVVVVALDHPYDSPVTELANGGWAYTQLTTTGDQAQDQALADQWAYVRASDLSAVIDHLQAEQIRPPSLTAADLSRITTAGHSLGGAAALEAARLDTRITGAVNMDGMPRTPKGTNPPDKPVLTVVAGDAEENPAYDAALDRLDASGKATRLVLPDVAHFGLTDASLVIGPITGIIGAAGSNGPLLAARATLTFLNPASK